MGPVSRRLALSGRLRAAGAVHDVLRLVGSTVERRSAHGVIAGGCGGGRIREGEHRPGPRGLLALPRRQRAVLVARFHDDLSVDQTAALLVCSESNVKSQTGRGLERLRTVLPAQPSRVEEA